MIEKILYQRLLKYYGHQNWWPGESMFEIAISAVLTQNTAWKNVEIVLERFRKFKITTAQELLKVPKSQLREMIKPVGFYQTKTETIRQLSKWLIQYENADYSNQLSTEDLRKELLKIKGIGNETADAILLYALNRFTSVSDKYTQRLAYRLGVFPKLEKYEVLANWLLQLTPHTVQDQNEIHALIVTHSKRTCTKFNPNCSRCPISDACQKRIEI